MARRSRPYPTPRPWREPRHALPLDWPRLHSAGQRRAIDCQSLVTEVPRCPICRHPLLAQIGRGGPHFVCACLPPPKGTRRFPNA